MKRSFFPLLATGLLTLASCSSDNKAATAENGNASDNTMTSSATGGDTVSATMPAGSGNPENQPQSAGTAQGTGGNGAMKGANDGNAGANGAMGDPNGPTAPHKDDKEFMMSAAHSDQNEIQQSKMALAKGVTGEAKEMANKMIADHTKSTAALKKIAAKKGVTLPADMDAEHKAMKPAMEKLSGQQFEQKYMAQMVTDHQKTANTMMAHEKMTQDADLKAFIGKTLPVVQQHLGMAQKDSNMKM